MKNIPKASIDDVHEYIMLNHYSGGILSETYNKVLGYYTNPFRYPTVIDDLMALEVDGYLLPFFKQLSNETKNNNLSKM